MQWRDFQFNYIQSIIKILPEAPPRHLGLEILHSGDLNGDRHVVLAIVTRVGHGGIAVQIHGGAEDTQVIHPRLFGQRMVVEPHREVRDLARVVPPPPLPEKGAYFRNI